MKLKIRKYKAKIKGTDREVVGFITPIRKHLGSGSYSPNEIDYLISVNSLSMPGGDYGTFLIEEETLKVFNECPVCLMKETVSEKGYFVCSDECYEEL